MAKSTLTKMDFNSGIQRESTQYAEAGSWYDADKVRFRAGKPENIGGYETKVSASFNGAGRDLITWSDNDQLKELCLVHLKRCINIMVTRYLMLLLYLLV